LSFCLEAYLDAKFCVVERGPEDMHDYQNFAVDFMEANPFSALFVDLGLGKSVISLTLIMRLLSRFAFKRVLVIAPKRVATNTWPNEIAAWRHTAPLTYNHIRDEELQDAVNRAGRQARVAAIEQANDDVLQFDMSGEASKVWIKQQVGIAVKRARVRASRVAVREATLRSPATIDLINREQVEFLVRAWGRDWPYDVVIIDESSCLKDHTTRRFKALQAVRPFIKRMHQLTATPAAETYMHLFSQIYLLDLGKRLGKNITAYRDKYFVRSRDGFTWALRDGADAEIAKKIADICLVMKSEDYLDLEKPIPRKRRVPLTPAELKAYKAFERDLILPISEETVIEAETAAALVNKLLQYASGAVYDAEKKVHHIHDHKIDELRSIVEEAEGEPLLVAYWFKPSLARLKAAFPQAVVMDKDGDCIAAWNAGKIPILLVHPQSAGHGLNLQKGGHHIVFFDIPWSLELYLQLIGRLARQGQEHVVILHHLIAEGTVDEDVVDVLMGKRDAQEILFRLIKRFRSVGCINQKLAA
jgi:SNF2 family DNA or RNA helicase